MTYAAYVIAWIRFLTRFFSLFAKDKLITVTNFSKCRPNGNDRLEADNERAPKIAGHVQNVSQNVYGMQSLQRV